MPARGTGSESMAALRTRIVAAIVVWMSAGCPAWPWLSPACADDAEAVICTLSEPLGPLEQQFFDDAADGQLDHFDLLAAAMVAAGAENQDEIALYRRRLDDRVKEMERLLETSGDSPDRIEAVFNFLHERMLRGGYRLEATDIRIAIDRGQFNCVSATVLFNYLARQSGLRAIGLETTGHALSRVFWQERVIDVETTCPSWFRLKHDPQKQREAVQSALGGTSHRAGPFREVSAIELAGMIYYNRGVDHLAAKQFRQAASANAKALRLDPASKTARGNLVATLNNWAIIEGASQRYPEAATLLKQGMVIDPSFETLQQNFVHVHHQWSLAHCYSGDFAAAVALLQQASAELPQLPQWRRMTCDIYRRWARSKFDARDIDGAFARFDEARTALGASADLLAVEEDEIAAWGRELSSAQQTAAATAVYQKGLARLPSAARLSRDFDHYVGRYRRTEIEPPPGEGLLGGISPVSLSP